MCQGIRDDNLLELARPKNPLSHLVESSHQAASVRSEECHVTAWWVGRHLQALQEFQTPAADKSS